MTPPPIGEALEAAWAVYKKDWAAIAIACLCAMLLGLIPLVGGGLVMAGLVHVSLKALRGQTPEPADGFIGLQKPLDHIVIGLLQVAGALACCVGVYVTHGVFYPGTPLILEKGMDWNQAKDVCIARVWPEWGPWTLFAFVAGLVGASGAILCGIGVVATMPLAALMLAYGYERVIAPALG
jgi:hypothetical protein